MASRAVRNHANNLKNVTNDKRSYEKNWIAKKCGNSDKENKHSFCAVPYLLPEHRNPSKERNKPGRNRHAASSLNINSPAKTNYTIETSNPFAVLSAQKDPDHLDTKQEI